ncbi:hypothetical protein PsYK624_097200 [Phanerochaete sordida]|uniref:Uncharacterized protein n=1 Tax=Phanerochaete sordida TaxID=48140 RepID=A0A9P3GER2_9APHY|nr:hypothetical protein PsYK624_097200 [Phanerochaete sordida]
MDRDPVRHGQEQQRPNTPLPDQQNNSDGSLPLNRETYTAMFERMWREKHGHPYTNDAVRIPYPVSYVRHQPEPDPPMRPPQDLNPHARPFVPASSLPRRDVVRLEHPYERLPVPLLPVRPSPEERVPIRHGEGGRATTPLPPPPPAIALPPPPLVTINRAVTAAPSVSAPHPRSQHSTTRPAQTGGGQPTRSQGQARQPAQKQDKGKQRAAPPTEAPPAGPPLHGAVPANDLEFTMMLPVRHIPAPPPSPHLIARKARTSFHTYPGTTATKPGFVEYRTSDEKCFWSESFAGPRLSPPALRPVGSQQPLPTAPLQTPQSMSPLSQRIHPPSSATAGPGVQPLPQRMAGAAQRPREASNAGMAMHAAPGRGQINDAWAGTAYQDARSPQQQRPGWEALSTVVALRFAATETANQLAATTARSTLTAASGGPAAPSETPSLNAFINRLHEATKDCKRREDRAVRLLWGFQEALSAGVSTVSDAGDRELFMGVLKDISSLTSSKLTEHRTSSMVRMSRHCSVALQTDPQTDPPSNSDLGSSEPALPPTVSIADPPRPSTPRPSTPRPAPATPHRPHQNSTSPGKCAGQTPKKTKKRKRVNSYKDDTDENQRVQADSALNDLQDLEPQKSGSRSTEPTISAVTTSPKRKSKKKRSEKVAAK